MTVVQSAKASFASGEISKRLYGRTDFQRYDTGLGVCSNALVLPTGGLTRRPPTSYVNDAYADSVFLSHEIARDDAFIIELGDLKARFYRDGGILQSAGSDYEIVTPYVTSDLPDIRYVTSGDVVYLTHKTAGMQTLTRLGNINWTIAETALVNGPFQDENRDAAKTILASAETGAGITLTATGFTFDAGHVGSFWKLREFDEKNIAAWIANDTAISLGALRRSGGRVYEHVTGGTGQSGTNPPTHTEGSWRSGPNHAIWKYVRDNFGVVKITAVAGGGGTATADVIIRLPNEFVTGAGSKYWSEGAFSDFAGWPAVIAIHEERLVLAKAFRLYLSKSGDYLEFTPAIGPDKPINIRLGSTTRRANDILWLSSGLVLMAGTAGEEYTISGSSRGAAITQTSIRAIPATDEGSISVDPVLSRGARLHVAANGRRVHENLFDFRIDNFQSSDITVQADHITAPGIKKMVWARNPNRVLWVVLTDGALRALTYMKEQEVLAWHRHDLSGGLVDDFAVMPSADGSYDEVWLIVRRTVNSVSKRYVERMARFFDPEIDTGPADIAFLDSQISYSGAPATVLTGFDHLENETVRIVADGADAGTFQVASGQVTLPVAASAATGGLDYRMHIQLLPSSTTLPDGSGTGRQRSVKGLAIRYIGGPGALIGNLADVSGMEAVTLTGLVADAAPVLESEVVTLDIDMNWEPDDFVDIVMDAPFAFDILSADRMIDMGA